jgi:hypothetical protein
MGFDTLYVLENSMWGYSILGGRRAPSMVGLTVATLMLFRTTNYEFHCSPSVEHAMVHGQMMLFFFLFIYIYMGPPVRESA